MSPTVQRVILRLLISTIVGIAMAGTTYLCAWNNFRDAEGYLYAHQNAYNQIDFMTHDLAKYRKNHGHYPATLSELTEMDPDPWYTTDRDPWNNPFQYRGDLDSYTLVSLGRDGHIGGKGLDRDIDAAELPPRPSGRDERWRQMIGSPSLRQFTFDYPTKGIQLGCALAGVFAFIACLIARLDTPKGLPGVLIGLGFTLLFCLWFAINISAIHVPNHH